MTEEEYLVWSIHSKENYAAEKEKEGLSSDDAKAEAEKSFERLLPQGKDTPNYYLYTVMEVSQNLPVGILWWGVQKQGSKSVAWIYDIELRPELRGNGFGRATMELAMKDALSKGYERLGLHVFGHNKIAQSLYQSMGFEPTNIVMYKNLN